MPGADRPVLATRLRCAYYSMCMSTLDRRVQVLFDPAKYAALETEAAATNRSVAALIREAVDDRLKRSHIGKAEAVRRLFARADANPTDEPIDWEAEKDAFEREYLRDLP